MIGNDPQCHMPLPSKGGKRGLFSLSDFFSLKGPLFNSISPPCVPQATLLANPSSLPFAIHAGWAASISGEHSGDDGPGEADEDNESDGDSDEDGGDEAVKIKKKVNFPPEIERGDVNPSTLVPKVEKAVQKRLARLAVHKDSLEGITDQTSVQTKFLG